MGSGLSETEAGEGYAVEVCRDVAVYKHSI